MNNGVINDGIMISLTEAEARALFIRFKREECGVAPVTGILPVEQALLMRIEKALYKNLSVCEAESLMKEITGK